ncbi:transglutaminase domain-containing protein [Clostridium massiliamazoniense]|uniref:transglutaminase domain-containing protein n=1 Tax=Clostridium massiliamazoniense TaxID=1347366 RepID=UPI0006D7627D|nr:transglutaminase domain-containing protein [Clostridium massiliamazoniense]
MITLNNINPTQKVEQVRSITKNDKVERSNFATTQYNYQGIVNCVRNSNNTITITYNDQNQVDTNVKLATNQNWHGQEMTNDGNGLWSITINAPAPGQSIQYKFIVNGQWTNGNYEANNIPTITQEGATNEIYTSPEANYQGIVNCVRNSNNTITITYNDQDQVDTNVKLTTNLNWHGQEMTYKGNGLWSITINAPAPGQSIQYKFIVNGQWTNGNYEANNIPTITQEGATNEIYTSPNTAGTLFTAQVVNCSDVFLNQQPGDNTGALATLSQGTIVDVIGMSGHWYKVSYNGQIGYIYSQYLSETTGNNFKGKVTYNDNKMTINGQTTAQNNQTSQAIIDKANEICANATTNVEKAKAIYVWIAENITYDNAVDNALEAGENVSEQSTATYTFNNRTGICLGFAELYADMCRAEGIQVRVINGWAGNPGPNDGHAWNEVYLPSLGTSTGWVSVDTTFASGAYEHGYSTSNSNVILDPNSSWDYFNDPANLDTGSQHHVVQNIQTQGYGAISSSQNTQTNKNSIINKLKNHIKKVVNQK